MATAKAPLMFAAMSRHASMLLILYASRAVLPDPQKRLGRSWIGGAEDNHESVGGGAGGACRGNLRRHSPNCYRSRRRPSSNRRIVLMSSDQPRPAGAAGGRGGGGGSAAGARRGSGTATG